MNPRFKPLLSSSTCSRYVQGGEKGAVVVRCTHNLAPWARYDGPGPAITALRVTPEECLIAGMADGRLAVWAPVVAG